VQTESNVFGHYLNCILINAFNKSIFGKLQKLVSHAFNLFVITHMLWWCCNSAHFKYINFKFNTE